MRSNRVPECYESFLQRINATRSHEISRVHEENEAGLINILTDDILKDQFSCEKFRKDQHLRREKWSR